MMSLANHVYTAVVAAVLLTAVAALVGRPRRTGPIRWVAVLGMAFGLGWTWARFVQPYDFKLFWRVGRDLAAGVDYYAVGLDSGRQFILNPPTALPLFRAWAALPLPQVARHWTALNALGMLGLVAFAQAALRAQMGPGAPRLPRFRLSILTAAVMLSCAHGMGLALGQISLLAAFALVAAVWAQGTGRPALAGLALAVATIKANTMLPFLALFLRRRDRRSWASLAAACLVLCGMTGPLRDLPRRVAVTVERIRALDGPGGVNDYSFAGPAHWSLIGLDHALYRLGLRDRPTIRAVQLGVVAALGLGLAGSIARGRLPRGLACALVGLYSGLFLYHRVYDQIVLVLPLTYAALEIEEAPKGPRRRRFAACAALVLLTMFVNPDGMRRLAEWSFDQGLAGRLVQAILLPLGTWTILLAFGGLAATAARRAAEPAPAPGGSSIMAPCTSSPGRSTTATPRPWPATSSAAS